MLKNRNKKQPEQNKEQEEQAPIVISTKDIRTLSLEQQSVIDKEILVHIKPLFFSTLIEDLKVKFSLLDKIKSEQDAVVYSVDIEDSTRTKENLQIEITLHGSDIYEVEVSVMRYNKTRQAMDILFDGHCSTTFEPSDIHENIQGDCLFGNYESFEKLFEAFKGYTNLGKLLHFVTKK